MKKEERKRRMGFCERDDRKEKKEKKKEKEGKEEEGGIVKMGNGFGINFETKFHYKKGK